VFNNDSCLGTAAGSLSFGSTQVTLTASSPAGVDETIRYASNLTTLTLFSTMQDHAGPVYEVQVYTLQQGLSTADCLVCFRGCDGAGS
jgi:hypothetical protein